MLISSLTTQGDRKMINDKYEDKNKNKHLVRLQMKHSLLDRKEEVKQLTLDQKRYYGEWLISQDESFYDSTNELKGDDLTFSDTTFEDGIEVINNNKGE